MADKLNASAIRSRLVRVAVVTPYYKEPLEVIRRAHDSVMRQSHPCRHLVVADGHPRPEIAGWDVQHTPLATCHADFGNTPRAIGGLSALNQGFEAIAYLDADNWFADHHIESLVTLVEKTGCQVAFSDRQIILPTGEFVPREDRDVVERRHVDTNCFFITSRAARLIPQWAMMEPALGPACDRIMLHLVRRFGISHGWTGQRTVFYESRWAPHFRQLGKAPPPDEHRIDWPKVWAAYSPEESRARLGFELPVPRTDAG